MKIALRVGLVVVAIVVSAVFAWGEGPAVVASHTLTGYSKSATTVTLTYVLQLRNRGDSALGGLQLSLVPRPPFITSKTTVTVDSLAPKASTNVRVQVATPLLRDQKYFTHLPLLWVAKCTDVAGNVMEFPVKTRQGGAR